MIIIFPPIFQDQFLAAVDGAVAVHHDHRGREIKEAGGQHKQPGINPVIKSSLESTRSTNQTKTAPP